MNKEKLKPYQIRLGDTLKEALTESAVKNQERGNVNAEIRRMLRKVLKQEAK